MSRKHKCSIITQIENAEDQINKCYFQVGVLEAKLKTKHISDQDRTEIENELQIMKKSLSDHEIQLKTLHKENTKTFAIATPSVLFENQLMDEQTVFTQWEASLRNIRLPVLLLVGFNTVAKGSKKQRFIDVLSRAHAPFLLCHAHRVRAHHGCHLQQKLGVQDERIRKQTSVLLYSTKDKGSNVKVKNLPPRDISFLRALPLGVSSMSNVSKGSESGRM
uniref:Coiled-coil domain-containing protein 167 n=1 Tax=Timema genevievae TaxID=629358 RepID=A0A7R9K921_TIMGE|nr:unnamed protein product [Timema genevievae]